MKLKNLIIELLYIIAIVIGLSVLFFGCTTPNKQVPLKLPDGVTIEQLLNENVG